MQCRDELSSKMSSFEWRIENFLDLKDRATTIYSPDFQISDANFVFQISPCGGTCLPLCLYKEDSRSDIHVDCTIGLRKSVDGSVFKSYHFSHWYPFDGQRREISDFIEISQLTADETILGPHGTLIIYCEERTADDSTAESGFQTSMPDTLKNLSRDFEDLFGSGCFTDISIDVKGKKFSANKMILSARSSVSRSMFELDMKEKSTGIINITDCDPESFGPFLLFLYSGKLDVITSDNACDLYVTAEKYNVQNLKNECRDYMMRDLCVDSVCDVVYTAELYEDQDLLRCATDYFVKNASEIIETSKWQTFVTENFTLANKLFIKMSEKLKNRG